MALALPLAGLVGSLALALAAGVQEPDLASPDAARAGRDRALDYLLETQRADGSWALGANDCLNEHGFSSEAYYAWKHAASSLALLALMEAPHTGARSRSLERGLAWLAEARIPKRGNEWDADHVWGLLYGAVALERAVRERGDEALAPLLDTYLAAIARDQAPEGGWAYYDDQPWTRRLTWGTSFCTALVLPTLARAVEAGRLDAAVLERARRYTARCALPDGAYEYDLSPIPNVTGGEWINQAKGSHGRTQVCNWGLARAGERKITTSRVRAGLESFFEHHRFLAIARGRPIPHEAYYLNAGYFYHFGHYYAAEAIGLLPADEREAWHARLRPHLLSTQRADGSCADFLPAESFRVASTAYVALALDLGLVEAPRE